MSKTKLSLLVVVLAVLAALLGYFGYLRHERGSQVSLTVDPDKVITRIDPKIYGQFYELIYHSGNGGLWGDVIFNRSFEEARGRGQWSVSDGVLANAAASAPGARFDFGEVAWKDIELSFDVRLEELGQFTVYLGVGEAQRDRPGSPGAKPADPQAVGKLRVVRTAERVPGGPAEVPEKGLGVDADLSPQAWHSVRVRAEKNRICWWLNGKQVGNVTETDKPPLQGRVGFAVINARAQFRGLAVASLDGPPLLERMPSPVRHWSVYGKGSVVVDSERPLNSQISLRVSGSEGESGVVQKALLLTGDDRMSGSLWARGTAPQGLVVRLLDGDKVLKEISLPEPTGEWKEYPIAFTPAVTVNNASIQIGAKGKADVWLDQVSMMPESSRATGGFRPDLLKAFADIRPPIVRWPGGSFTGNYRWKDGIGPQSQRGVYPTVMWDDRDANNLGTDEFIQLCRKTGAEPLIVINIGSRDSRNLERAAYIQETLDWMEYCNGPATSRWGKVRAANGHPEPYNVKYWEIDNETWSMGPEAYIQAVKDFVPPMRKKYPNVKIAVCGGAGTSPGFRGDWDETLLKSDVTKLYDYHSIHHYEDAELYNDGVRNFDKHFAYLTGLIRASQNPNIKLYVSEWNLRHGPVSQTWRNGLYAGGLLNTFERHAGVVEMGGPALFMRHLTARRWDQAFINFDHTGWFPGPNYVVMKLWRDNYAPNLVGVSGDAKDLYVNATTSEEGDKVVLKAVNPSSEAARVNVELRGAVKATQTAMQLVAPGSLDARNSLEQPAAVRPGSARASLQGNAVIFNLPPFSAGVVSVDVSR